MAVMSYPTGLIRILYSTYFFSLCKMNAVWGVLQIVVVNSFPIIKTIKINELFDCSAACLTPNIVFLLLFVYECNYEYII